MKAERRQQVQVWDYAVWRVHRAAPTRRVAFEASAVLGVPPVQPPLPERLHHRFDRVVRCHTWRNRTVVHRFTKVASVTTELREQLL